MTLLQKFLCVYILFAKFCFAVEATPTIDLSECEWHVSTQATYFFEKTALIPITGTKTKEGLSDIVLDLNMRTIDDAKFLADSIAQLTRPNVKIDFLFLVRMSWATDFGYSYAKIIQVINNLPDQAFALNYLFIRDVFFGLPREHSEEYFLLLNMLIKKPPFGWEKLNHMFRTKRIENQPIFFAIIAPKYTEKYETIFKKKYKKRYRKIYKRWLEYYGVGYHKDQSAAIPGA